VSVCRCAFCKIGFIFYFHFANNIINDLKHLIRSQLYIYYTLFKMVNQQKKLVKCHTQTYKKQF
jgi:hypothetical protein